MISIITWVNNKGQYHNMVSSIRESCGWEDVEFIEVGQEYDSMAKAYNYGTSIAKGDILVYMHQDVLIHDKDFKQKLNSIFTLFPSAGFVGPIGNIQAVDHSWWVVGASNCRGWVRQGGYENILSFGKYTGVARQLDGLMLSTNKRFTFPEQLPGLHFVDMWMCLQAERKGYQNMILDLDVQHISGGENSSQSYSDNLNLFRQEYYKGMV